ncbi:unnamed protein product [Merluccius merluccius]
MLGVNSDDGGRNGGMERCQGLLIGQCGAVQLSRTIVRPPCEAPALRTISRCHREGGEEGLAWRSTVEPPDNHTVYSLTGEP